MAPSRSRISDLLRSKFGGSKTRRRRRRKADPQTSGEHLEERTLLSATYKDDSIIVRANPGVTAEQLEGQVQDVSVRALGNYGLFHVVLPVGADVHDSIESYEASSLVQYAQTNNTNFTPSAEPNDPQFPDQYHLNNTGQTAGTVDADIDATEAWDTNTSAENIIIAIIDSGTDLDHEDLADNIWVNEGEIPGDGIDNDNNGYIDDVNGWDFVNQTNDPNGDGSSGWHGTHVAGIAGAVGNSGIGVSGVAWNVQLMPLRIFAPGTSTAAIVEAINYSVENGAQVSNNSWGGYGLMARFLTRLATLETTTSSSLHQPVTMASMWTSLSTTRLGITWTTSSPLADRLTEMGTPGSTLVRPLLTSLHRALTF